MTEEQFTFFKRCVIVLAVVILLLAFALSFKNSTGSSKKEAETYADCVVNNGVDC